MLFLAFVGGALVGGAAAVLFAPRSGAETRRRITGAVDDTKEVASRMPKAIREASSAAQAAFARGPEGERRRGRGQLRAPPFLRSGLRTIDEVPWPPSSRRAHHRA